MLFNSIEFIIFFIAVTTLYFNIPQRLRWALLLVASCYFYMAFIPWYVLILFFLIILDYTLGLKIDSVQDPKRRRHWLWISILSNVGTLFIFKYFNFFNENFAALFGSLGFSYPVHNLSLLLPLGLSFHAFQSLAYVIEVYKGKVKAERHLGIYAVYVMFFPQLVAGPIERPDHMLPQFTEEHKFSFSRMLSGVERMAWGFFKKIVVADHIALLVNAAYGNVHDFSGPSLAIATMLFAFQIYCDFSGYCDIAIGAARVLGFRLSENFNAPYLASSISSFWRRWHITLSMWFRDYVFIPLGGSRGREYVVVRNLLLTFLLSGLWHGANWTFMVWGLLNGLYLVIGRWKKSLFPNLKSIGFVSVVVTFMLSCFAWIFFRAESMNDALSIVSRLGSGWREFFASLNNTAFVEHAVFFDRVSTDLLLAVFGIIVILIVENLKEHLIFDKKIFSSVTLRVAGYTALAFLILALWEGRGTEFIYFQF